MSGWVAPGRARERVLVYGGEGVGKTAGILFLARRLPAEVNVWGVDTDGAFLPLLEEEFADLPVGEWHGGEGLDARGGTGATINVWRVDEWTEIVEALAWTTKKSNTDDWVVLDSTSDMWDDCIGFFTRKLCGDDLPGFLVDWRMRVGQDKAKKQGTQGSLIEDGLYDYVNPTWNQEVGRRTKKGRCHVYMTSQAGPTGHPKEDQQSKSVYEQYGWKPRTNKRIGFDARTVILLGKTKTGKRTWSVVKDWARESQGLPTGEQYEDLAREYLFKRAGWRPTKGPGI